MLFTLRIAFCVNSSSTFSSVGIYRTGFTALRIPAHISTPRICCSNWYRRSKIVVGAAEQSTMLKRNARLRREYLYRKSLEGKEKETYERKRKIREALAGGC